MKTSSSHIRKWGNFLARQDGGWKCRYCDIRLKKCRNSEAFLLRKKGFGQATIDHIVPLSKGGSDEPHNMVLACEVCNLRKGDLDYPTFIRILERERVLKSRNLSN